MLSQWGILVIFSLDFLEIGSKISFKIFEHVFQVVV